MSEALSWVAVNTSGEVCLDSDLPPLPRGWERCLDLKSGIMYLKQMNAAQPGASNSDGTVKGHKRQKVFLGDDHGEGDPALQLTLSLPTTSNETSSHTHRSHTVFALPRPTGAHAPGLPSTPPSNQSGLSDASSLMSNGLKLLASQQAAPTREDASATGSSGGGSPSSSSSSSTPSQSKQVGCKSNVGLRENQLKQEKRFIGAAGCPHCFMYVLPSKSNPKCPRCNSSILVDLSPLTIH